MDGLHLRAQFVRHRRALGFVFGVDIVAERFAFGVKHAGDVIGWRGLAQFAQHVHKAVDGVGGRAIGGRQFADRMKSAVQIRRTVNEQKPGHQGKPSYTGNRTTPSPPGFIHKHQKIRS